MGANVTKASDWEDWKKTCAFLNCSTDAQKRLGLFGVTRMRKRLGVISEMLRAKFNREENPLQEAWHWLDVHIIQKDSRGGLHGKACKDWLFDKGNLSTTGDLEKYMSRGFFRAAAQDYAKENLRIPFSLDQPVGSDEDGVVLKDLIPAENLEQGQSSEINEFEELVQKISKETFDSLKKASKIALAASELNIRLDLPEVKELTGLGRAALYDHVKRANAKTLSALTSNDAFSEYETNSFGNLDFKKFTKAIISQHLAERAVEWARNPENSALVLFEIA